MKLSDRLRCHKWKSSSLAPGDHGWDYSEDPIKAADALDRCEELLDDLLSCMGKRESGDGAIWARVQTVLADLQGRPIGGGVTIYYVLEDRKLRELPFNVEAAIDLLREEFIAGHTHGVLCVKDANGDDEGDRLMARGERDWPAFEVKARAWLMKAINIALMRQHNL
jgi:ABC-type phosphonate transport system ATPase subunit